jgi:fluoride exporter
VRTFVLVAVGGALGSVLRYAVSLGMQRLHPGAWPLGTLTANLVGCLGIGLVMGFHQDRSTLGVAGRMFLGVGLLGGFTTFSAFAYEGAELLRRGAVLLAALYAAASVAGGIVAAALGVWIANRV